MAEEPKKIDLERIRKAVAEILLAVGEDIHREGLQKTPERVARMYTELLGGTLEDPHVHLQSVFTEKYDEIVLLRNIPFYSVCEHHLCRSSARPTWPICRRARSWASARSRGSWTVSPTGSRPRSG